MPPRELASETRKSEAEGWPNSTFNGRLWYDDGMDENPYQSPESEPDSDPKQPDRYTMAVGCAFLTFGGIYCVLGLKELLLPGSTLVTLLLPCLIAAPAAGAMGFWGWRHPDSKWPLAVAYFLAVSWLLRALFEIYVLRVR